MRDIRAREILREIQSRGVRLEVNGERLRVDAPVGALTPELKAALAANKREILRHLDSRLETRLEAAGFCVAIDRATGSVLLVFSQSLKRSRTWRRFIERTR
jgi:TubC N-terminal docking domain